MSSNIDDVRPPVAAGSGSRPGGEPGRPRREDAEELVCSPALVLAERTGYAGATIELIARECGVSKSTIYRRWRSKELLYVAAAERWLGALPEMAADVEADAIFHVSISWFTQRLQHPGVAAALSGVFAQATADPALRREVVSRLREPHAQVLSHRLGVARERLEMPLDLVVGAVLQHHAVTGRAYTEREMDELTHVADFALHRL